MLRKQSTLQDMKSILKPSVLEHHDPSEYAHRVLEGPVWTFTTIVDFLCATLKNKKVPMTFPQFRTEAFREHYDISVFERGMEVLRGITNIGTVWNKEKRVTEYVWHDRRTDGFDELNQQALDAWRD